MSALPPNPKSGRDVEAFRTAFETRNMEISLFWQRSNYFLVLNTAIAAGFVVLVDDRACWLFSLA